MSNVSSVTKFFATANEGFVTTISSSISSGASTVPINDVTGLTNGSVFVGIIEPGQTNQQVFTGTVDTSGLQITGVVWTRGSNVSHAAGVTVVDYVTGTGFNMMSTAMQKEHLQIGAHGAVTATSLTVSGNATINGTTTLAGNLNPSGGISAGSISPSALASVPTSKLNIPYNFSAYDSTNQTIGTSMTQVAFNTELYDTGNNFASNSFTAPVAGWYHFDAGLQVSATGSLTATYIQLAINGTAAKEIGCPASASINTGNHVSADIQLAVSDVVIVRCAGNVSFTCAGSTAQLTWFNGRLVGTP